MPKSISVIIPTFNRSYLLKRCLKSVLSQQYKDIELEVIVVDDGSSDQTKESIGFMCSEFKNLKYFRQENKGHAAARQLGFAQAKGDILVSLDDDCIPSSNWLENIAVTFIDNPKVDICCGRLVNPVNSRIAWAQHFIDYSLWIGRNKKYNINLFPLANTAYKREAAAAGVFTDNGKYYGYRDILFNFGITNKGFRVLYNPDVAVWHHRWDLEGENKKIARDIFIQGQLRHGRGLRNEGYKVYGKMGRVILGFPGCLFILLKMLAIFIRAWQAGMLKKFLTSSCWVMTGLYYQASGIKDKSLK